MGFFSAKSKSPKPNFRELPNDEKMEYAYEIAKQTIPAAVESVKNGLGHRLSIKTRFTENGKTEHAWITVNSIFEKSFGGVIANDLEYCTKQKCGDVVVVKHEDVTDWLFLIGGDGKMMGNFTLRASWNTMSQARRDELIGRMMPMPQDEIFGISLKE